MPIHSLGLHPSAHHLQPRFGKQISLRRYLLIGSTAALLGGGALIGHSKIPAKMEATSPVYSELHPLLEQIPNLAPYLREGIKPEFCTRMEAPKERSKFTMGIEALWNMFWTKRSISDYRSRNQDKPTVFIQWVRFSEEQSKSLEITYPCDGPSCPMTKDNKPATGRAVIGKDMINWHIQD